MNLIIEIPPISDKDCYYIQERYKPCFNYPLPGHDAYELNFVEHCAGARTRLSIVLPPSRLWMRLSPNCAGCGTVSWTNTPSRRIAVHPLFWRGRGRLLFPLLWM